MLWAQGLSKAHIDRCNNAKPKPIPYGLQLDRALEYPDIRRFHLINDYTPDGGVEPLHLGYSF